MFHPSQYSYPLSFLRTHAKQIALFILIGLLLILYIPQVGAAGTVVITPANMQGWGFLQETSTAENPGTGQMVIGPGTTPLGTGSAHLFTTDPDIGESIATLMPTGTPLSALTTLTYSAYRHSGSSSNAVTLQFDIDRDPDPGITVYGRLVFEPTNMAGSHPISDDAWQTWDGLDPDARWWITRLSGTDPCNQASPCSWSNILSNYPGAQLSGAGLLKIGSGWSAFEGNVDNLVIGISGDETTYDFELSAPVHNVTQDTYHTTIQDGVDMATAGDIIEIDPGTYPESVIVDKSLTLRGAGAGTDPALNTILDGTSLGTTTSAIHLNTNVTNVTIEDLTVQNYTLPNSNYAGISGAGDNNNFTVQRVHVLNNVSGRGGVYLNGPVDNVLIDNVTAHDNQGRGIVIWNGFKTNITITNNDVRRNNCCGIELQDGTASGVTITGNTVVDNADSGMAALGLMSGAGANLIANNTVTNNGRFGIEIKNPNGTGLDNGDGSIVIENNTVSLIPSASMDRRDHAGIAVFRRDFQLNNPNGYVDVPTGVVMRSNTVYGYRQERTDPLPPGQSTLTSEGFGMVIEGTGHTISGNTLENNDIGIQEQGGLHPNANYVYNDIGNGDQENEQSIEYFGRGNAPVACGNTITSNTVTGNGTDIRQRVINGSSGLVINTNTTETFCTIQAAIDDSDTIDGHNIQLDAATYAEEVHVTKDITINGASTATTILNPTQNTSVNNGDSDGWWLVDDNVELHLNDMTFDGSGYLISQAIRQKGEGSITNVDFTEIKYNPSTNYRGIAVAVRGTGPVHFTNVNMSEIGRIGIHFGGAGVSGSVIDNLTYTGKGSGDWLDYGVEFGWGAQGTVQNSHISGIRGVADVDGSTSACIYATTYFGEGTAASIINTELSDCTTAVSLGYDSDDTAVVTVKGSTISDVEYAFSTTGGGNNLTAYANNMTNFGDGGLNGMPGIINARHNWWGTYSSQPTGVDNDSWAFRLGAPMVSWADGTNSASLSDTNGSTTTLSGGSGTAVLVNHGRQAIPADAPFGKAIAADIGANQCSDFYDAFVIGGSGNYNLELPVDAGCTNPPIDDKLFQFDLDGSGAPNAEACAPDTACWNAVPATRAGNVLTANLAASDLLGTPYVAPSINNNDPTAVTLSSFSPATNITWVITAVLLMLVLSLVSIVVWKRQN